MSRVRRAYELTPHQADALVQSLCPHAVFPLELWHRAYEHFWRDFVQTQAQLHKTTCLIFPQITLEVGKFFHWDLCGFDVSLFFNKLSRLIDSSILKKGLEYILAETFTTFDDIFPDERAFLFDTLHKIALRGENYDMFALENLNDEVIFIPASSYHFISRIFFETMLVDRVAAILELRDFPLLHEEKGLTRVFVDTILNTSQQKSPNISDEITPLVKQAAEARPPEPQEQNAVFVRQSVWAGKTKEAIRDIMRSEGFADEYIVHILLNKRGLPLAKRAIGKLLGKPHLSDAAYDKLGKELVECAERVTVRDTPEA